MPEEKFDLFEVLKDINYNKSFSLHKREDFKKGYNAFMINKFLSMGADTLFEANFMNRYHKTPIEAQYLFLSSIIEKKNRFLKFIKSDKDKDDKELVKYIRNIHRVNQTVAEDMLKTITNEEKAMYKEIFTQKTIRKR